MDALSVLVDVIMAFSKVSELSSFYFAFYEDHELMKTKTSPRHTVPLQVKPPAVSGEVLSSGLLLLH